MAAVICETVRSTPYFPPPEYWMLIREACDRHGALLILDEIPHCLGRTGKMFSCEHYGVVPDMLVIGKGLGGGIFPLAALIARDDLDVARDRALGHYTHEKSPVGCAAALATLDIIADEGLLRAPRRSVNTRWSAWPDAAAPCVHRRRPGLGPCCSASNSPTRASRIDAGLIWLKTCSIVACPKD